MKPNFRLIQHEVTAIQCSNIGNTSKVLDILMSIGAPAHSIEIPSGFWFVLFPDGFYRVLSPKEFAEDFEPVSETNTSTECKNPLCGTSSPNNVSSLESLFNDLGTIKWLGADAGWDSAIESARKEISRRLHV